MDDGSTLVLCGLLGLVAGGYISHSCSKSTTKVETVVDYNIGKTLYNTNCISCHNIDYTKDGSVGPAIVNSSKSLLYEKVVNGQYPEGYKPKRQSDYMQRFKFTEAEINELYKYLNKK